jgi:diadenosine tetraphosphate (Ap4A) HIT family hydrolase
MKSTQDDCLICQRIRLIKNKKNPFFIKEYKTGYAVLGDSQYHKGYCVFLCKIHKTELHKLDKNFKLKFLEEMSLFAEAVYQTYKPDKLNYELLGNEVQHLHWHIFPRYKNEKNFHKPVWLVSPKTRNAKKYIPDSVDIKNNIVRIKKSLKSR